MIEGRLEQLGELGVFLAQVWRLVQFSYQFDLIFFAAQQLHRGNVTDKLDRVLKVLLKTAQHQDRRNDTVTLTCRTEVWHEPLLPQNPAHSLGSRP